ncbi:hypothetical protein, partial [Xanthomonas hortorum]|uniref:hypothetical protein n=1 Tax=Xanthomonas hortorum TaxID=56454 RepID=UPI001CA55A7F
VKKKPPWQGRFFRFRPPEFDSKAAFKLHALSKSLQVSSVATASHIVDFNRRGHMAAPSG